MRVREPRPDGCAELAWMHLDLQDGRCQVQVPRSWLHEYNAVWIVVFGHHGTT